MINNRNVIELKKIKNNLDFTIDDIAVLILIENNYYDFKSAQENANIVYHLIRSETQKEWRNDDKEFKNRDCQDIELLQCVSNNKLENIENDLRLIFDDREYSIYKMIVDKYDTDYIKIFHNISKSNYYRIRDFIFSQVVKLLLYK